MSIKQNYALKFSKITSPGNSDFFVCDRNSEIHGSVTLAILLQCLGEEESQFFLDELNLAISGVGYEEDYTPDAVSDVWVDFSPPNAIVSGSFTIPLIDLKELMEEWIEFVQQ